MVKEENPERKRPFERSRLRWKDVIKKDVESLNGGSDWKALIGRIGELGVWRDGVDGR